MKVTGDDFASGPVEVDVDPADLDPVALLIFARDPEVRAELARRSHEGAKDWFGEAKRVWRRT